MGQRVRVHNFTVSADGYGTGEGQSLERPFGHADPGELIAWGTATASWPGWAVTGGSRGLDDYFTRDFSNGIGAEIMGRNKFGPQRGPWADHDWTGWWGDIPPFHTPVIVLTHHERPSITLSDTTFHFLDAPPNEAVERATALADGLDAELLLPADEIADVLPRRADWKRLLELKSIWGVSIQALLYRARTLGVMPEHVYRRSVTELNARGWRTQEPGDDGSAEDPLLLAKAVSVAEQRGIALDDVARMARLPIEMTASIVSFDQRPEVQI